MEEEEEALGVKLVSGFDGRWGLVFMMEDGWAANFWKRERDVGGFKVEKERDGYDALVTPLATAAAVCIAIIISVCQPQVHNQERLKVETRQNVNPSFIWFFWG